MFEITASAREKVKKAVKDRQDIPPIRIIASRGGCCGSVFSIGFDQSRKGDEVFKYDGFTFVIDKNVLKQEEPMKIDYIESPAGDGFTIAVQSEGVQHNLISLLET